jgi:mono/diheme cytochrome c family protein
VLAPLTIALALSSAAAAPTEYLGANTCGACHADALEAWSTGPHAGSLARLTSPQAEDPACRTCHTLAPWDPEPELGGVQCEACHGAGRDYAPEHIMRDPVLARLLGLVDIDAQTCAGCHRPSTPSAEAFDFATAVRRVCVNRRPGASAPPAQTP